jgi:hypothetical protein
MNYSAIPTTTVRDLLGRAPMYLTGWARRNRGELLAPTPLRFTNICDGAAIIMNYAAVPGASALAAKAAA